MGKGRGRGMDGEDGGPSENNDQSRDNRDETSPPRDNRDETDPPNDIVFEREGLCSSVSRMVSKVARNVTLEPVMFFISFVGSMDSASLSQLVIDKSCNNDFDFNSTICDNLLDEEWKEQNIAVQDEVAQFKVYESIVDHLFPVLCSFFLGSWSDTFGRKLIIYIYFVFRVIEGSLLFVNAYFIEWPKEYFLFTVNLPVALSGGYLAFSMGIHSFIADISTPEQRSFRMAMMHFVSSIGRPIGTILGAYLFEEGGYLCVIGATLLGRVLACIFLVVRLEMFQWKPKRMVEKEEGAAGGGGAGGQKRHHALSPRHVLDSIRTVTKKRENHKRAYLWVYLMVMLIIVLPFFGEMTIGYNYVRTRYNWDVVDYSEYRTISEVIDIAGQAVLIPLLGYLQINDCIIIPLLLGSIVARHAIKGLAYVPWLYYLGSAVDIMGGYSFAAARSTVSKCVDPEELGKVFAILASLESLVPIGMSQAYASLWKATSSFDNQLVGACFFVSASITTVAWILATVSMITLRGRDISELDEQAKTFRPTFRMTNKNFLVGRWTKPPTTGGDVTDGGNTNAGFDGAGDTVTGFTYNAYDQTVVETISGTVAVKAEVEK